MDSTLIEKCKASAAEVRTWPDWKRTVLGQLDGEEKVLKPHEITEYELKRALLWEKIDDIRAEIKVAEYKIKLLKEREESMIAQFQHLGNMLYNAEGNYR